ncbi:hypothetical protein N8I77_006560 [Diaporthe amygdali]|uniref:Zn(2)-C6 fungal-type domain-containing protein n=1 Tax=Phomopsis amygdali TaxID=1214568 RepID=A0AAD9SG51_PHOAM|nr:hypothetical protein N8I77_006560 [Diaporthe amygdali]
MFSTFTAAPAAASVDPSANSASPSGSHTGLRRPGASSNLPARTKPKRSQVSRACDWCRVHRIKCDNAYPCHNCQARGGQCSNKGSPQVRTLPQAFREIEKLRQRVKELEEELGNSRSAAAAAAAADQHQPEHASPQLVPKELQIGLINTSASLVDSAPSRSPQSSGPRRYWEGVHASPNNSHAKQFFGPSSLLYFIKRMEDFLATTLQQPVRDQPIWFNSASKSFASPFPERANEFAEPPAEIAGRGNHGLHVSDHEQYLNTTQEEFFLNLFWQSYHSSMQIIDETAFREHYKSLCDVPGRSRRPSALVDIIVAICMQYGIALLPPQEGGAGGSERASESAKNLEQAGVPDVVVGIDDATIAGRWHYFRCQALLTAELESPTITTLQCHIFSVIYLCNASFQTTAHSTLGLAVRTAQILGLHLEPSEDTPHVDRELRKRIWWTLQTVEIKTCMKLGRPLMTSSPPEMCSLPSDDYQLALLSSSTTSVDGGVTWLTYSVQNTKLVLAARATHVAFFDRCDELLTRHDCATIYENDIVQEECAEFLQAYLRGTHGLQTWLQAVPEGLKSRRKDGGEAYSTDCSALEVERFAPTWLQRHRLLLELLYHNLSMNLFRPFITFPSAQHCQLSSTPSAPSSLTSPAGAPLSLTFTNRATPLSDQNAKSCVRHAIALTTMIHEALRNTELLGGWHEAFQWQWNAAVALIGFIFSDSGSELYQDARRAIDHAIEVFEIFGRHFAVGTSAASVTRDLAATADRLLSLPLQARAEDGRSADGGLSGDEGFVPTFVGSGGMSSSSAEESQSVSPNLGGIIGLGPKEIKSTGSVLDMAMGNDDAVRSLLDGTMNMAYGVDSFGGFEFSFPEAAHFFEGWTNYSTGTGNT